MDMSLVVTDNKSAFAEQLAQTLSAKFAPKEAQRLREFAELFFDHYPIEELSGHDINDVIGMLKDAHEFLSSYKQRRAKVRVFNPSLEQEGWYCKNTVVTVHYNDVPFVIDSVRMALTNRGIAIKRIKNLVIGSTRDTKGQLISLHQVDETDNKDAKELLIHLEINRHSKIKDINEIATAVRKAIADVNLVNNHYVKIV